MSRFVVKFAFPDPIRASHDRDTEAAALALAADLVGARHPHVTITGHSDAVDTFAIRHLTLAGDDSVGDTGWRCWVEGRFVGASERWPMADALVLA